MTLKKKKPMCKLSGVDGNIFNVMGVAGRALVDAGLPELKREMFDRCLDSNSYGEALGIICEYVDER